MKNTSPLFTVIIPCKNRAQYLKHTLQTCMMQNYDPLEVIVSDDGSTDNTREVVEDSARHDPRIRYVSPGKEGGMRNNFEYALRQVKPGFVIALGGDDGILPDGIAGMWEILRDTGMGLLAWPAPTFTYPKVYGSTGQLAIYNKKGLKIVDSQQFLNRQVRSLNYISDIESPMFYVKGVASTAIIDRVRARSRDGRFYSCPTPDGYSGIVLAGEVKQYAFSGKPFSIFGLSSDSQGYAYLSNSEKAKKESQLFFQNVAAKPMHHELASQPYSPVMALMTVDYLLTARDLPGWPGKIPPIDFRKVLLNGINELKHGLWENERIIRELEILNEIAEMHGLGEYFRYRVKKAKRYQAKARFDGSGISASHFFLDANSYDIENIVDAAYAAKDIYKIYSNFKLSSLVRIIYRSFKYRYNSIKKGGPFPPESEWSRNSTLNKNMQS